MLSIIKHIRSHEGVEPFPWSEFPLLVFCSHTLDRNQVLITFLVRYGRLGGKVHQNTEPLHFLPPHPIKILYTPLMK